MKDNVWTDHDTEICERAKASGVAINMKTGKPLTIKELQILGEEFDKVRSIMTVDEFLKDKVSSKPFEEE